MINQVWPIRSTFFLILRRISFLIRPLNGRMKNQYLLNRLSDFSSRHWTLVSVSNRVQFPSGISRKFHVAFRKSGWFQIVKSFASKSWRFPLAFQNCPINPIMISSFSFCSSRTNFPFWSPSRLVIRAGIPRKANNIRIIQEPLKSPWLIIGQISLESFLMKMKCFPEKWKSGKYFFWSIITVTEWYL